MSARALRLLPVVATAAALMAGAPAAAAKSKEIAWEPCGDAPNVECATVRAPLDYDRPHGDGVKLFVARSPATATHRLAVLELRRAWRVGRRLRRGPRRRPLPGAQRALRHHRHGPAWRRPERAGGRLQGQPGDDGIYSQPFTTPFNLDAGELIAKDRRYIRRCIALNGSILPTSRPPTPRATWTSCDQLGDRKINYLGFSYGTFVGATYASLFPQATGRWCWMARSTPKSYINDRAGPARAVAPAFERALGRFFQACAADQGACLGSAAATPGGVRRAVDAPTRHRSRRTATRPIRGRSTVDDCSLLPCPDVRQAAVAAPGRGARAAAGRRRHAHPRAHRRVLLRARPGRRRVRPGLDRYFTFSASEQRYRRDIERYLEAGDDAWGEFDHVLEPRVHRTQLRPVAVRDRDAYNGPFRASRSAPTPLVVATKYDPATTYRGALRLVRQLGKARLLTMWGDGHTAYEQGSPDCIDPAIETYINTLALPAPGTTCRRHPVRPAASGRQSPTSGARRAMRRVAPQVRQLVP